MKEKLNIFNGVVEENLYRMRSLSPRYYEDEMKQ